MKLGKAFSDSLVLEVRRSNQFRSEHKPHWWQGVGRVLVFVTLLWVSLFILIWRLFDLTIIRGHQFRILSDGNRIRELVRHAPRGLLLDRTGKPIVRNVPQYRLIKPCEGTGTACVLRLTQSQGAKLERGLASGTFVEIDYQREYLYPEALAQISGYIGELSTKELAQDYYKLRGYTRGDTVGRTGAEAVFEERLRGRDGKELVEVDAQGKILRTLGRVAELAGQNVTLSVDASLGLAAASAFPPGERGAIVVSKPSTGEILALFSNPTFDPNKFSLGMTQAEYTGLLGNSDQPLLNRAIGGVYPPGSTFKLVTGMAGLSEGAITKNTTFEDTGFVKVGGIIFNNWYFTHYGRTDGTVDIVKAFERSNDVFFYKAGEVIGIDKLAKWAAKVGIGKPLGIELGGEAGGMMPDPAWKKSRFDSPSDLAARNNLWYTGDTFNTAIGQGYLQTTPLQVNFWTDIVANGGRRCVPTIEKLSNLKRHGGCTTIGLSDQTISLITEGMRRACADGGTGWPLFNFSVSHPMVSPTGSPVEIGDDTRKTLVPVACKTGTAEFGDPQDRTHAWFTAFAPLPAEVLTKAGLPAESADRAEKAGLPAESADRAEKAGLPENIARISGEPELTVTVLVEKAGEGSNVAAPIAKKIFEEWFGR